MDTRRQHDLLDHLSFWMLGEGVETKDEAMRVARHAAARRLGALALVKLGQLRMSFVVALNGATEAERLLRAGRDALDEPLEATTELPKAYRVEREARP